MLKSVPNEYNSTILYLYRNTKIVEKDNELSVKNYAQFECKFEYRIESNNFRVTQVETYSRLGVRIHPHLSVDFYKGNLSHEDFRLNWLENDITETVRK